MQISINFRKKSGPGPEVSRDAAKQMAKENSTARNARSLPSAASSTALGSAGFEEPPPIWHKGSFFPPAAVYGDGRALFFFSMSNLMPIKCSQSDVISSIFEGRCDTAKPWLIHVTGRTRVFLSRAEQGDAHRAPRTSSKTAFVGQEKGPHHHGSDGALLLGAAHQNRSSETFQRFHFNIFLLTSFPQILTGGFKRNIARCSAGQFERSPFLRS